MSTPTRERTDAEILLHLCRALALKSMLTSDDADDDHRQGKPPVNNPYVAAASLAADP